MNYLHMSSHRLEIETGRWAKSIQISINLHERLCITNRRLNEGQKAYCILEETKNIESDRPFRVTPRMIEYT